MKRLILIRTAGLRMIFRVKREKLQMAIAWSLPEWLVYWCAIRLVSFATVGKWSGQVVPDLTAVDALKRWGTGARPRQERRKR